MLIPLQIEHTQKEKTLDLSLIVIIVVRNLNIDQPSRMESFAPMNVVQNIEQKANGWPKELVVTRGKNKGKPYTEQQQRKQLKKYLIHKYGDKCMECGWSKCNQYTEKGKKGISTCQLEHTDGNPLNNKLDNLLILCPNCHSLTEFYGARGKGCDERRNRFPNVS